METILSNKIYIHVHVYSWGAFLTSGHLAHVLTVKDRGSVMRTHVV